MTQNGFTASWRYDRLTHSQTTTPPYSGTITAYSLTVSSIRGVFGASQVSRTIWVWGNPYSSAVVPATAPLADFPDYTYDFLATLGGSISWLYIPATDIGYGALVTNWFGAIYVSRVYLTVEWEPENSDCYYNGSPYGSHFVGPGIN